MTRLSAVVGAIVAVIAVAFIAPRRWEAWTDWRTFLFDTIAYPLLLFALIQVLWPGRGFRRSIGRFGSGARSSGRTPIPSRLKQEIFARDERLCRYCGHYAINAEVDHVLPVARGGTNTPKNLVTACRECNAIKADRTPDEAGMVLHEAGYRAPNFMAAMAVGEAMKHQDRARSGGDRRP